MDFFEKHPDEVFTSGEVSERGGVNRVRDIAPTSCRITVGRKTWYGVPSAIKTFKKELEKR
jgi:hypothetical protein